MEIDKQEWEEEYVRFYMKYTNCSEDIATQMAEADWWYLKMLWGVDEIPHPHTAVLCNIIAK